MFNRDLILTTNFSFGKNYVIIFCKIEMMF